jgi:hypothetical protein
MSSKIFDSEKSKNKRNIFIIIFCIMISVFVLSCIFLIDLETSDLLSETSTPMDSYIENISKTHNYEVETSDYFQLYLTKSDLKRVEKGLKQVEGARLILNPSNSDQLIDELKPNDGTVVIFPTFTAAAYSPNGFYSYYYGTCDESCINDISFENFSFDYNQSGITAQILYHVGYDFLTDIQVDKNPELLNEYETVILLHNEYVTKKEFDAITGHSNLIFLHPNALYAEIDVNHETKTMTLIRGHDYPPEDPVGNGFDYAIEQEFHHYEYNNKCENWEFVKISNGFHLNCYPETIIRENLDILNKLKMIMESI